MIDRISQLNACVAVLQVMKPDERSLQRKMLILIIHNPVGCESQV